MRRRTAWVALAVATLAFAVVVGSAAGKPAAGVRVGLLYDSAVPQLRNMTDHAGTSPYWLAWLAESTTTDAQGRFALDHIQTGLYRLLVSAPPAPRAPSGATLPSVQNGPSMIDVSASSPGARLGEVAITP